MGSTALCPGTFDPVTNGHLDIITRAGQCFDAVVVGVLENPSKEPLFDFKERVAMLEEACAPLPNIRVGSFHGLLVEYAKSEEAAAIVKGQMNHRLGGVETLFMPTNPTWSFLSSSLVKEVARFGGDVGGLVPDHVKTALAAKLGR